jgi:hypothetical protein
MTSTLTFDRVFEHGFDRRLEKVLRLRRAGATYRLIGTRLGISGTRVQQLYRKAERRDGCMRRQLAQPLLDEIPPGRRQREILAYYAGVLCGDIESAPQVRHSSFLARLFAFKLPSLEVQPVSGQLADGERVNRRDFVDKELQSLIGQLRDEGWTYVKISWHLGVSASMVAHYHRGRFKASWAKKYVEELRPLLSKQIASPPLDG